MTTTVTAADNAPKVLISQSGRKGDPGTDGTNGDGFNQVRKSLLDNPLCHLFKTNKLVETSAPTSTDSDVTWNRSTSATYVDRYGTVKTAAINTPREEQEGFLIEGASTNIATYSEQFGNSVWVKQGAIPVTANATTAPDGTMTADNLDDTSAAASGAAIQNFTLLASTTYTYSVFLKQGTAAKTSISSNNSGGFITLTIDWATFALSGNSLSTSKLEIIGNGWVRLSITITTVGAAGGDIRIYPADSDSFNVAVGSVYAWGAQIEQLPFASSYIPTVATPITRTADLVTVLPTNNISLLNLDNTISFTCDTIGSNAPSNQVIIAPVATNIFSRLVTYWGGNDITMLDYISGGALGYLAVKSDTNNIVSTYNSNNAVSYVNGNLALNSPAPYTHLATSSSLIIGSSGSSEFLFGHIKDLKIYDFALNANEAEYLSA